jgi:hypothetical protein
MKIISYRTKLKRTKKKSRTEIELRNQPSYRSTDLNYQAGERRRHGNRKASLHPHSELHFIYSGLSRAGKKPAGKYRKRILWPYRVGISFPIHRKQTGFDVQY